MKGPPGRVFTGRRDMPTLPADVVECKRTRTFTHENVPRALLTGHRTKASTWAVLNVESGALVYRITEPGHEAEHVLGPRKRGVIAPEEEHHIQIVGAVAFHIQFFREPKT